DSEASQARNRHAQQRPFTKYKFVTGGSKAAVAHPRTVADGKNVELVSIVQQILAAGLVDKVGLHIGRSWPAGQHRDHSRLGGVSTCAIRSGDCSDGALRRRKSAAEPRPQNAPICMGAKFRNTHRAAAPNGGYLKSSLSTPHLTRTSAA